MFQVRYEPSKSSWNRRISFSITSYEFDDLTYEQSLGRIMFVSRGITASDFQIEIHTNSQKISTI